MKPLHRVEKIGLGFSLAVLTAITMTQCTPVHAAQPINVACLIDKSDSTVGDASAYAPLAHPHGEPSLAASSHISAQTAPKAVFSCVQSSSTSMVRLDGAYSYALGSYVTSPPTHPVLPPPLRMNGETSIKLLEHQTMSIQNRDTNHLLDLVDHTSLARTRNEWLNALFNAMVARPQDAPALADLGRYLTLIWQPEVQEAHEQYDAEWESSKGGDEA